MLAMLGPKKYGRNTMGHSFSNCSFVVGIPLGAPKMSTPPHEITNVRAKYVSTGCLLMKALMVVMMFSLSHDGLDYNTREI
jgi:hypothetical protein